MRVAFAFFTNTPFLRALADTALPLPTRRGCLLLSLWHLSSVCCWQQYNHLEEQTTIFNQWSCCSRHVSKGAGAFNCMLEASEWGWQGAETRSENFRAVLNIFGKADRSQVSQAVAPARNYLSLGAPKAQLAVTLTVGLSTKKKHTSAVIIVIQSVLKSEAMYVWRMAVTRLLNHCNLSHAAKRAV